MGSAEVRAGDQRFTVLVSRAERGVDISTSVICLVEKGGSAYLRVEISGWYCWRTAGRLFQGKREQFGGENSERPVVFWRPSEEKVRG